ncbi:uncharacterized protein LOC135468271 [Liolophura sinensis]|uniref:uncharacterized protein LOC135468271 n=1 Tax=Liolophura sinensis TaxID=3198878 RepID=UPI0031582F4D
MVRYFVCKCATIASLRQCVESGVWACKDRDSFPNPRETLTKALGEGTVILVFSVNNCHGWHGVCEMISAPGEVISNLDGTENASHDDLVSRTAVDMKPDSDTDKSSNSVIWHRFRVRWRTVFIRKFGERCLSSQTTSELCCFDGQPVNKCRNLQELPEDVGEKIWIMIEEHYNHLSEKQKEKEAAQLSKQPGPFLKGVKEHLDFQSTWRSLVEKVERDLGKVLLACPFGSQRYNLHRADSDMDMFIVYQADTKAVLGLEPPKHTIKNREGESYDYTVHEVHRYCELLTQGDPRCVETLFLHPSSITHCSDRWRQFLAHRDLFLHSLCLEKYLRDGLGSKGLKQFEKWMKDQSPHNLLTPKLSKLVYIILRLLQNARDVTLKRLCVYREEESLERQQLLKVRRGEITGLEARQLIEELLEVIEANKCDVEEPSDEMRRQTEAWLLKLRYDNFLSYPPEQT